MHLKKSGEKKQKLENYKTNMNIFKIGDKVIGLSYPDLIPAKVIEIVKDGFVNIEFEDNGRVKTQILPEYRLKHLNNDNTK